MSNQTRKKKISLIGFLLRGARGYLGYHLEMLRILYLRVMMRTSGGAFCFLYNLRAWFRGADVRVGKLPDGNRYFVSSGKTRVEVYPHQRANNYEAGIGARALKLGQDYFLPLVTFRDGDLVVDCGANVGDLKLYFAEKGIAIRYIGIEPGPGEFARLERNVAPSQALNYGCWNQDGSLNFYVSSKGADSSLIEPPFYDSIIQVPTKRLDSLIQDGPIKLLKIEAEGAEPEVLEGAAGIMDRVEYISADLGAERGLEQTSTLIPVVNYLLARNFELVEVSHGRVVALFRNKAFARV